MADEQLTREMTAFFREGGAVVCGYADLTPLPGEVRRELPVGIVFALPIEPGIAATLTTGPTREYAAEYDRLNRELNVLGVAGVDFLCQRGFRAHAQGSTLETLPDSLCSLLPHKTVATRAGVGWIGKCALLVTEAYGAAIRLNSILTDAPLQVGVPVEQSQCGECDICCRICPGGAPSGTPWQVGMPRDGFFNAHACAAAARQLAATLEISRSICGRCIGACPWTQRYLKAIPNQF